MAGVTLGLLAAVLAAAPAMATDAPAILRLKPLRERLRTIDVTVNGQPGTFLLDTGGGGTIISPAFAAKIGCKPWGRLTGFRMTGERLDSRRCDNTRISAGGVQFAPQTVGVVDLPDLKPGEPAPDGSLALDVLRDRAFTLDVSGDRLILETPESRAERTRGAIELPVQISRELSGAARDIYIQVPTRDGPLWFILDSGAGAVILVARDLAGYFGLDPAKDGPQPVRLDLAPGVVAQSDIGFTPDMIMDGNLGMPFIRRHVITVDMRAERLWIRPVTP